MFYLRHLYYRLDDVPGEEDRLWFALASYNAGYGHIRDARRLAEERGRDSDIWFGGVAEVLPLLRKPEYYSRTSHGYCRCTEVLPYVRDIRDCHRAYAHAVPATPRTPQ